MTVSWLDEVKEYMEYPDEDDIESVDMRDNEVYLALIGRVLGDWWYGYGRWPTEGSPSRVSFDPELVHQQEEKHGDVVGFFHTHPNMTARPSAIDYGAMGGWTVSFGKMMACCIEGIDGLQAHWFLDDEHDHITMEVNRFGNLFVGKVPSLDAWKDPEPTSLLIINEKETVESERAYVLFDGRACGAQGTSEATVLVACESDEEAKSFKEDYGEMACYSYEKNGNELTDERWEWDYHGEQNHAS